jgi:SAM-dependent methyltransferase
VKQGSGTCFTASAPASNEEQVRYWNEVAGPRWVQFQERLDREMARLGVLAMERAGLAAGEAVLDVGCGCGATALEIARRVGLGGRVLGVDVSRPMLERACARAQAEGATHVSFLEADAQTAALGDARFDLVFSRFGLMFFADPPAAFANLRRALRAGGRVSFVCWQRLADNPWMLVPLGALAKHLSLPPPPPPGAPGPFAFADPERVEEILRVAGFADVARDDVREPLRFGGGDLDGAVDFALELGPAARALREANAGPELRARVAASVREALVPFASGGAVSMPSAAWRFGARNPG